METKYVFYSILALLFAGSLISVWYITKSKNQPDQIKHSHTILPVKTTIIREKIPGTIDTVYVGTEPHEFARLKETIKKDSVTVSLDVAYDRTNNLFSLNADIAATRDSIYVEKIINKKQPLFRPTAALGAGFKSDEETVLSAEIGVAIANKYRLSAFVATDRTVGLRVGIDF
jgi:hypothetical protein